MDNRIVNKEEEVRHCNPLDELAYVAIDKAEGDVDKAMDEFYSIALFLPSETKVSEEELQKKHKELKVLKESNRKLEEETRKLIKYSISQNIMNKKHFLRIYE